MASRKLNREQVDLVLHRAAELEREAQKNQGMDDGAGIDERELSALVADAGLDPRAVDQALAEFKRGALRVPQKDRSLSRAFGISEIVVSRTMEQPKAWLVSALETFMRQQLMVVHRHHGDRIEWIKSEELAPHLLRSPSFAKRYCLGPVDTVETVLTEEPDGSNTLTLVLGLHGGRRHAAQLSLARGGLWTGLGFVMAQGVGLSGAAIVLISAGAATLTRGFLRQRSDLRSLADSARHGCERQLDFFSQGQWPAPMPAATVAESEPHTQSLGRSFEPSGEAAQNRQAAEKPLPEDDT